jgi:hypothetical protein
VTCTRIPRYHVHATDVVGSRESYSKQYSQEYVLETTLLKGAKGRACPNNTSWCAPRPSHRGAGLVLTGLKSSGTVTRTGKSQNCCGLWHYRRGNGHEGHLHHGVVMEGWRGMDVCTFEIVSLSRTSSVTSLLRSLFCDINRVSKPRDWMEK